MNTDILQWLQTATTDTEREAIALEMRLSLLPSDVQAAVTVAAIPHWFDVLYLEALLGDDSDDIYAELLTLSFVEQVPGKGYAIHERTRQQLLNNLWQTDPAHFLALSQRAADYCTRQTHSVDDPEWEAEAIYHQLFSDPDAGVAGLRRLATKWANYEYHSYDEIERALRWANEQIAARRLTDTGIAWTRLWQAKLALIYHRSDQATVPLAQIDTGDDQYLAAEVAQTRGDLLAQTGDRAGMATAWQTAHALYEQLPDGQGQLDAYLVIEKMRQHGLPEPDAADKGTTQPHKAPSRNALQLIDNIHVAWIEGVLNAALAQENTIDLSLNRARNQRANLVLHRREGIDRPIVTGQRLSRLFDAAERSLLILGAPGSGKTITLLQLLDELLQQARLDATVPIPLLFNLSSFGNYESKEKTNDLLSWLAEQAYDQYRINRERTRSQLRQGQFVLLLDGLDEVTEAGEQRERCVTAINNLVQTYPCGLVVCSRIGDYEALQNELTVNHALVLQPLTNGQIEAFIQQAGGEQATPMLAQVEQDWQLREVLRSPLLLNLYPPAFAVLEKDFAGKELLVEATVKKRRKTVFASFANAIFESSEKKGITNKNNTDFKEKSLYWLSFLGNRMQQAGISLFFIEEIQPSWLPHSLVRRYRGLYGLFIGLIIGSIIGLLSSVGFFYGLSSIGYKLAYRGLISLFLGLYLCLFSGIGGTVTTWLTTGIRRSWPKAAIGGSILGMFLLWPFFTVADLRDNRVSFLMFLIISLGVITNVGILPTLAFSIQLRERIRILFPSRQRAFQYIKQGKSYGLISGLVGGMIVGIILGIFLSGEIQGNDFISNNSSGVTPSFLLINFLIFGLIGTCLGALRGRRIHGKIGLVIGSLFGLLLSLFIGLLLVFIFGNESMIVGLVLSFRLILVSVSGLIGGLLGILPGGLIGVLLGSILSFLDIPSVDKRPTPGAGIRASLINASLITLLMVLLFVLAWIIVEDGTSVILILGALYIFPTTFTWFGGLAWCQHWALRWVIAQQGWLPLRLVPWLDNMAALGLLRRVGGGYIFIHRSLLEYFAELDAR